MKVYVIQSKNRIMMNADANLNQRIGVLVKMVICGVPVHVILSVIRHVKTYKHLDIKNYDVKNICLVSYYQHVKILNTTETTVKDFSCLSSCFDIKQCVKKIIALFKLFHYYLYACFYQLSILLVAITIIQNIG